MKYYKIQYNDGKFIYDKANNSLEIIKRHDLATREHIETRVIELSGEQKAIAADYLSEYCDNCGQPECGCTCHGAMNA